MRDRAAHKTITERSKASNRLHQSVLDAHSVVELAKTGSNTLPRSEDHKVD